MSVRWVSGVVWLLCACSVPQPELPEPAPEPEAPTYRDPNDLPGPHPQPVPAAAPDPEAWQPVDPATLSPFEATPCNPGLAPLYQASPTRDMGLATQVHRAILGCIENGRLDDAGALADALVRDDAQPADAYFRARATLARRGSGGETVCVNDAYMSSVLQMVEEAASPEFSARMMVDPAFEPVRSAFRYKVATMPGEGRVAERLAGTVWHGPGVGAYGTMARLTLNPDGTGVHAQAQLGDDGMPQWTDSPVTWSVEGDQLVVQQDGAEQTYTLEASHASLSHDPGAAIPDFFDYPSECEA